MRPSAKNERPYLVEGEEETVKHIAQDRRRSWKEVVILPVLIVSKVMRGEAGRMGR